MKYIPFLICLVTLLGVGCSTTSSVKRVPYEVEAAPLSPLGNHEVPYTGDELRDALTSTPQSSALSYGESAYREYSVPGNDSLVRDMNASNKENVSPLSAPGYLQDGSFEDFSPPQKKQALDPVSDYRQDTLPVAEAPARLIYVPSRKSGSTTKESSRMLVATGEAGWAPEVFDSKKSFPESVRDHPVPGFRSNPYYEEQADNSEPVYSSNPSKDSYKEEVTEEFIEFGVKGLSAADRMKAFRKVPEYPGGKVAYVEGKGWGIFISHE